MWYVCVLCEICARDEEKCSSADENFETLQRYSGDDGDIWETGFRD